MKYVGTHKLIKSNYKYICYTVLSILSMVLYFAKQNEFFVYWKSAVKDEMKLVFSLIWWPSLRFGSKPEEYLWQQWFKSSELKTLTELVSGYEATL